MADTLKHTALFEVHKELGAKFVSFGGYEMPVQYSGIIGEHRLVRNAVGVFDVSHMGEVEVKGRDSLAFLQSVLTNDVSRLTPGRVQYSAMCYEDGGIVDDLLVYHLGDHYMLVINASNVGKDFAWLQEHVRGDVVLDDRTEETALLAVQGPRSLETLRSLTKLNLASLEYYHSVHGELGGMEMIISRTGYTGELGYELYFPSEPSLASALWHHIMEAGAPYGIGPVGLGARDTLRLEMGFCLYGHDIDATTNPLEAGLGWITKLDKGPFVGRDALLAVKRQGVRRRLAGFTLREKAFPRHGYLLSAADHEIGFVTSGTFSPVLGQGIGMGYVLPGHAKTGTEICVVIRDRQIPATIVPLPFISRQ